MVLDRQTPFAPLASCLRRSLISGVTRGGIRLLGNGALIGSLSEAEEDLE
jgi:hypothetical protein